MKLFIICLVVLQIILADCRDRRAFPHHIETGTALFVNGLLMTNSTNLRITFATSKDSIQYNHAVTYQSLHISYVSNSKAWSGRYSLLLNITDMYNEAMVVSLFSGMTNQLNEVSIRYLIVEQSFPYIQIVHYQWNANGQQLSSSQPHEDSFDIGSVDPSCRVLSFISGMDLIANVNNEIQIQSFSQIRNKFKIQVNIFNTLTEPVLINAVWLQIIIYELEGLQRYQGTSFIFGSSNVVSQNYVVPFLSLNSSLQESSSFFGISNYSLKDIAKSTIILQFLTEGMNLLLQLNGKQSADVGYIFFTPSQYSQCISPYYWDDITQTCMKISRNLQTRCKTTKKSTICISCPGTLFVDTIANSCVVTCPDKTYPNTVNSICYNCMSNCQICPNKTSCTTCATKYYWKNTFCSRCITNCASCSNSTNCLSCASGYHWYSATSTCLSSCPSVTYLDSTNNNCISCSVSINNCDACSDSSVCISCTNFNYLLNPSTCSGCIINCKICNGPTDCSTCKAGYFVSLSGSSCQQCSLANCQTCSNTAVCGTCQNKFYWNGTDCESCIANCNKCSNSNGCTICDSQYYLSSSTCWPCTIMPYCLTCSNYRICTKCISSYYWDGSSCKNCISNCQTCHNGTTCDSCISPFTVANMVCVCPEGQYNNSVTSCQNCIDAVPNCMTCSDSITCTKCNVPFILVDPVTCNCPVGMYLDPVISCNSCGSNCAICLNSSNCNECESPYLLKNGTCILDCSSISYCQTCTYDQNATAYNCTQCESKFYLHNVSKICQPDCGNGFVVFGIEECDDKNTADGDGCSNTCTIEPHYSCKNITNQTSNCTLISLGMNPLFNVKNSKSNQFTMSYSLEPSFLPIYSKVAWTQAFTVNGFDGTVSAATYDSAQNRLIVTVQYNQNLDGTNVRLTVNAAPIDSVFTNVTQSNISCLSSTQNNLKLDFYDSNAYALAAVVEALSIVTAIISLLLFVAGYFGAKLIALECVATVQLSSLLLFTLQKVNPTFHALHFLGISLGRTYSQSAYSYQPQSLPPQFKGQTVSYFSAVDYGLSILTVFIPLIVGAVLYALLQTSLRKRMPSADMWNFAVGEYTFYGLAFCSYSAFATLAIDIRFCDKSVVCFIGIATSAVLGLVIIGYCVYFTEHPLYLGQFKKRFERMNICQHFYNFAMIERMANAFLIVCLTSVSFQAVGPLIVLSIELSFILYRKPYVLRGWIRSSAIKSLMIVIVLLFLAAKVAPNSIAQYIPLLILGCLLICQIYSCVKVAVQLKERWKEYKGKDGINIYTFEEGQHIQLKEFQSKIMPEINLSNTIMTGMLPGQKLVNNVNQIWKLYDKPYSISANMIREIIKKQVKSNAKILQDQQEKQAVNQQQNQI